MQHGKSGEDDDQNLLQADLGRRRFGGRLHNEEAILYPVWPGLSKSMNRLQTRNLFVAILALGLFTMAARSVTDPDVWWHLRTGQLIVQGHKIFHTDPYSFSKFGQLWIDHEWLAQILIYATYSLASWGGLIFEFAAVIATAFWIVFLRSPGRPYIAGAITAWGAVASIPSWGVRPQMLTLLLASVFLLIVEKSYRRPNLLWWAPALMLLWVNLHAGYALGIVFLVLYLVGNVLDLAFGQGDLLDPATWFKRIALTTGICIAVVPLNPYGVRLYSYPLETLRSAAMLSNIAEWLSPNFHETKNFPILLMILAILVLCALSPKKLRPSELLLLTATLYAALRSVRHIPIFVLIAVPILSGMIQACLEQSGRARLFDTSIGSLSRSKLIFNWLLLIGMLIFCSVRLHYVIVHQSQAEAREFPAAAASFIAESKPPSPMLNHYNWGGYFIWKLYPEYRVFIDGRADVYGDSFINNFASTYYLRGPAWQSLLEKWNIRTVVLPPDSPLVTALKSIPGWKTMFADPQAVVLSR